MATPPPLGSDTPCALAQPRRCRSTDLCSDELACRCQTGSPVTVIPSPAVERGTVALGIVLAITMHVSLAAQRKPLHPEGPFPYKSLEVSVQTAEGTFLRGTLTVPQGTGPFPAMVLIPGGQLPFDPDYTFREAPRAGYKPYLVVADFFSRRGFVTIRLSERANKATATSQELISDWSRAIALLKSRPEVDPRSLGLFAHSMGGHVAALVAAESTDVTFMVVHGAWAAGPQTGQRPGSAPIAKEAAAATPQRTWSRVRVPLLAVAGASEVNRRNLPVIAAALESSGNPDYTTAVIPGLDHSFWTCVKKTDDGGCLEEAYSPDALDLFYGWIRTHTKVSQR